MATTLHLDGLDETLRQLKALPAALTDEGRTIVAAAGSAAAIAIRQAYPRYTGTLRQHVQMTTTARGRFGVQTTIINTAPHAHIFERGTQGRHRYTKKGYHRGVMPVGNVFIPQMIRARRRMYGDVKALLARAGLVVKGDA